jgi:hypothetical protein
MSTSPRAIDVPDLSALPGGDLVMQGLRDLAIGAAGTPAALLVEIGRPRLGTAGLRLPPAAIDRSSSGPAPDAELRLYAALVADGEPDPYGRYNALLRRLISCEAALERLLNVRAKNG